MERLGHSFIVECVLSTQEAQGSISSTKAKSGEEHETDLKKTISENNLSSLRASYGL